MYRAVKAIKIAIVGSLQYLSQWPFMLPFTREFGFLAVSECKKVLIWLVVRVDIQLIVPCRPYPLGWHADELEYEGFDAAGLL